MESSSKQHRRAIIITGTVGSGKTTVMTAITELLERANHPNAGIDMDHLRWFSPKPPGDPFGGEIGRKNLAFVASNYHELGINTLVIADVVEHEHHKVALQRALPNYPVHVVRLKVPRHLVEERLGVRESPENLQWYLDRAPELVRIMDAEHVGDTVIEVGERDQIQVAEEIVRRLGLAAIGE